MINYYTTNDHILTENLPWLSDLYILAQGQVPINKKKLPTYIIHWISYQMLLYKVPFDQLYFVAGNINYA